MTNHKPLPEQGLEESEIFAQLGAFKKDDPAYKNGKLWSLVYYLDEQHQDFLKETYHTFQSENGLNPGAFKSLKKMENDIISAMADLLHGTEEVCGVVTSGGTESCLLAVKTYRDRARAKLGIKRPEMIISASAHVAWFKAAEYFDVKIRLVPLLEDMTPDLNKLKKFVNRNTIMILGGAPEYPHGTIDPIEAMGEIAQSRGIGLHVDACVGGVIMPFIEMNGEDVPRWDYRVSGVTSISADLHKYGYASKGASTITYRSMDYLRHQMFVYEDWPGGVFASAGLLGTRPGGAYSAAWSSMQKMGKAGYRELAAQTVDAATRLKEGIEAIEGLAVMGRPIGPIFSYRSVDPAVSIYAVGDQMDARGWSVNRNQFPEGLHAMVTAQHAHVVDDYLADLRECVDIVRANPELAEQGSAATYGMIAHVPLRGQVRKQVLDMFSSQYQAGGAEMNLAGAGAEAAGSKSLLDKAVGWYVRRQSQKGR